MNSNSDYKKILNRLDCFFIIMGLIEIFVLVLITSSFYGLIIGLSIIIPAFIALNDNKIKWNYFVGILAIIKYNPLIWIGLVAFIFGDMHTAHQNGIELMNNFLYTIAVILEFCFVLLVITSFIFAIVLLDRTSKQLKL